MRKVNYTLVLVSFQSDLGFKSAGGLSLCVIFSSLSSVYIYIYNYSWSTWNGL